MLELRPTSSTRHLRCVLAPLVLLLLLNGVSRAAAVPAAQVGPVEKLAEGEWTFAAQNNGAARSSECADSMEHSTVSRYRNIAPGSVEPVYAARWRYVTVNGARCTRSAGPMTATIFMRPSATVVTADALAPFFLTGQDNSPRRCGRWVQTLPARYYFTRNLPQYREFFEDHGFLSVTQNSSAIVNAKKGEIFMMSQQFNPRSNNSVTSRTVCFYKKVGPTPLPTTVSAPTPSPVAVSATRPLCFPADATAELRDGQRVRMRDLRIGDAVLSAPGVYSHVFFFSHRAVAPWAPFLRITLGSGRVVVASREHYLRLANGELRAAGALRVNDLLLATPSSASAVCVAPDAMTCTGAGARASPVVRIDQVAAQGLYAPHTLHGDIIVDGVLASGYTTAVPPRVAHLLLAPLRALWRCCGVRFSLDARDLPARAVPAARAVALAVHAVRNLHLT